MILLRFGMNFLRTVASKSCHIHPYIDPCRIEVRVVVFSFLLANQHGGVGGGVVCVRGDSARIIFIR